MHYLYVALGGALGALCRYQFNLWLAHERGYGFPVATLFVNVFGSFLIGIGYSYLVAQGDNHVVKLLLMAGILGGFTTFSGFSLDTMELWLNGMLIKAAWNIIANVIGCLLAVIIGLYLGRQIFTG